MTFPNDNLATDRPVSFKVLEPGNGTRYELCIAWGTPRKGDVVLAWTNATGGGRCAVLHEEDTIAWTYLAEKFGVEREADIAAILGWLEFLGFKVMLPERFDSRGRWIPHPAAGSAL